MFLRTSLTGISSYDLPVVTTKLQEQQQVLASSLCMHPCSLGYNAHMANDFILTMQWE